MGVSTKMNPGRIILDNVLEAGFEKESIFILKPGHEILAGCRCVPDFASLPEPVDLAVLCIGAGELPATVEEIISEGRAETLILIAGGLGERPGTESHSQALGQLIEDSRATDWRGPLVNGGNCLGVRSVPGRYDTLFIPRHKLSYPEQPPAPLALISQSGALAVAKASCFAELNPRYLISLGNQIDLTVGDYLTYLKDDDEVRVFACYVEGFQPLDGRRWVEAAAEITRSGRAVVLYRAGRTEAGGRAAATHTASIAGDYAVTRELASAAGVLVADTLADFEDLVRLACALDPREVEGNRLAALSNAGFESVAIADSVQHLELAELARTTVAALDGLLASHRLSTIVGATNPLDVTPILGDAPFTESFSLLLEDEAVDLGLVGCVPLTGALQTLESGEGHREDIHEAGSVVQRLARLWRQTSKPWVAAVDGGPRFDAMARLLAAEGVPAFRTIDRAARLLETYVQWRLRPRR
jgi:acyl-CoA synthetase (NDP forming)